MKRWYLILTAAVAASALLPQTRETQDCIDNCNCKLDVPSRLQVLQCDRPLTLNVSTFRFVNKPGISVVSFENVIIDQVQEDAFKGFKVLEDVLFLNARIGSIDDKAFNHIKRVKFADCGFEDSPDLFSEKLEELHFGSCHLEQIPTLNGLLSLTFLNLSGNYIKDVGIESFAELFSLEELYLTDNEIFKLPPTLFINNQVLNSLYLDNNPLQHFYLNTSVNLETLSVKNCQLETFDERATQRLSTLNELNLSNNKIKNIAGKALAHMKDLTLLDLSYNQLEQLDDDVFAENNKLTKITLDGNKFTTLPDFSVNSGTFSTYIFSCKYCGLKYLPSTVFQMMPGMIDLHLSHNEFKNVDDTFRDITSLKVLDISYNKLDFIAPIAFINNKNLETLNIAGNSLVALNPMVFGLNHVLKEIDARNTSLQQIWSNRNFAIKSLEKLLIANNNLTTLTIDDFKITPNLKSVDLNNNPLVFSDKFCNVIDWLDDKKVKPIKYMKNIGTGYDRIYDNFDGFIFMSWRQFYDGKCPEVEEIVTSSEYWKPDDEFDLDSDDKDDSTIEYDDKDDSTIKDEENDDGDDYNYDEEIQADEAELTSYVEVENSNLARASYILSVTSVFILTALVVLTLAVTITLAILRRNSNFNMHKANLPRLKIPLWYTTTGEKKHSGSVYRPLSEDLSGPKTPKLSRYEFASTPTVHSSNP